MDSSLHRIVTLLQKLTLTNKKIAFLHKTTYEIQNMHILDIIQVLLEEI